MCLMKNRQTVLQVPLHHVSPDQLCPQLMLRLERAAVYQEHAFQNRESRSVLFAQQKLLTSDSATRPLRNSIKRAVIVVKEKFVSLD